MLFHSVVTSKQCFLKTPPEVVQTAAAFRGDPQQREPTGSSLLNECATGTWSTRQKCNKVKNSLSLCAACYLLSMLSHTDGTATLVLIG